MKYKHMKTNYHGQTIVNEVDLIDGWLSGRRVSDVIIDDVEPINIYNNWCNMYDSKDVITAHSEYKQDNYIEKCMSNWAMPEKYKELDIVKFINDKELTYQERDRVQLEIEMYRERGLIPVLRFLVYLVDLCKENNIVLGVGRGSSVASYVLYLLGVHRVNSIKYDLDIKEFLK
jgi:DNA polymerase III alpha subunit|tara:strand:- start:4065 stop:4586 length:522 start_codon:yes stop_codon:yes gene_type:complete